MKNWWHRFWKGHEPLLVRIEVTMDGQTWDKTSLRVCAFCWPKVANDFRVDLQDWVDGQ